LVFQADLKALKRKIIGRKTNQAMLAVIFFNTTKFYTA